MAADMFNLKCSLLLLLTLHAGCRHTEVASPGSQAQLDALIAQQGSLTFRSFDGEWIGTDCDTDLIFLPNGKVFLIQYGIAVDGFAGTYRCDTAGFITLQLPTFQHRWPSMNLRLDSRSLLLATSSGTNSGRKDWPYRPIAPSDEEHALAMMERLEKSGPQ